MCLNTTLSDVTGDVEVRVWDSVCFEFFGVMALALRTLWEEGHSDVSKRETIL